MIFVTVGAQMPFDRLVRAVDEWAGQRGRRDVFAQIGPGGWRPGHIAWAEFLRPAEFQARLRACSVVVAHAGMGSILTALEAGKPIVVMPRRADLAETRNDHQVATAREFLRSGRVDAAMDENELRERLGRLDSLAIGAAIARHASPELLATLRSFVARGANHLSVTGAAPLGTSADDSGNESGLPGSLPPRASADRPPLALHGVFQAVRWGMRRLRAGGP